MGKRGEPRRRAVRTLGKQAAPEGIWASSFDVPVAVAICQRLAAGESLRSICRADPTMPTEKTVWNWARRHAGFAEMKGWAMGQARRKALAAQVERDAARPRQRDGYSAARGEAICEALAEGASLQAACARPGMPSVGTVYNWLRRYPAFVDAYRAAREMQADVLIERGFERAMACANLRRGRRVMRATDRELGRLYPRRYAAGEPPGELVVQLENAEGWIDAWRIRS